MANVKVLADKQTHKRTDGRKKRTGQNDAEA